MPYTLSVIGHNSPIIDKLNVIKSLFIINTFFILLFRRSSIKNDELTFLCGAIFGSTPRILIFSE